MKTCEVENCKRSVFTHGYCIMHKDRYYSGKEREPNVIPVAQYRQMRLTHFRKKKKYHNQSKQYNGRTYHSKLEANFAQELDWRMKAGEIKEIIPQFKIDIRVNGHHINNYFIDFKVINADESITFFEVKGMELEPWKTNWKLCMALKEEIEPNSEWLIIK